MARKHLLTHPVIGAATWRDMQKAADAIRKATGRKICTWCHRDIQAPCRTRCTSKECAERIWQAYSWAHCARNIMRASRTCALCHRRPTSVDHIIPVSLGGTGDASNLRALCTECHATETLRVRKLKGKYVARTRGERAEFWAVSTREVRERLGEGN